MIDCERHGVPVTALPGHFLSQGKYGDAEPIYRRSMEIMEATLGRDHPEYSTNLNNLAVVLEMQVRASVCLCTPGASFARIDLLPRCLIIWTVIPTVGGTEILFCSSTWSFLEIDWISDGRMQTRVVLSSCHSLQEGAAAKCDIKWNTDRTSLIRVLHILGFISKHSVS